MAKISLNKSELQKQREELKLYRRVLPSLDMKRMQLMGEAARARAELAEREQRLSEAKAESLGEIPMLADRGVELSGLVRLTDVRIAEENQVGVRLPVLEDVAFQVTPYSLLGKPHWVDRVLEQLQRAAELEIEVRVAARRVQLLEAAVRRITQRVNLFEKVLIPRARKNIQRIQIFLADAERAAVIRSKLAKSMHRRERTALQESGGGP